MTITHLNPETLHRSPFFSQGVLADRRRTLVVGGQNGTNAAGEIRGDTGQQSEQALRNVLAVLAAAGAGPEDVIHLRVQLAADADVAAGFAAAQRVWGDHPTALTVLRVVGFARPDALVEIDALAAID